MPTERGRLWLAWGLWFSFWLVLITIASASMAIFISYLDNTGKMIHRVARWWARALLKVAAIRVEVEGLEHLQPGETYVVAANHRSQFDIFVLLYVLPGRFLWVAKKSLFEIPCFGQALTRMGSVPVDRGNLQEAIKSLNQAAAKVQAGASMIIFPEGTRASSRELLPFKKGVFVMAVKAGRPIVPIAINGTRAIQPRGTLKLKPGPIRVVIAPPLEPRRFRRKEELMQATREAIAARFDPDFPSAPGDINS